MTLRATPRWMASAPPLPLSGAPPGPTPASRLADAAASVPLVTLFYITLCCGVYLADVLGDYSEDVAFFLLRPDLVLNGQVYRIVTGQVTHGGLLHLVMNMMSLHALGSGVEALFGSVIFAATMALFVLATGGLYVLVGAACSLAVPSMMYSAAVGFSGVIFALAVDEASLSPAPTRSVFGLFSVPTKLYPWVLMAVLQFLIPGVSLLGHLCGLLVGCAHVAGWFDRVLPSVGTARKWEETPWMGRVVRLRSFKLAPQSAVLREGGGGVAGVFSAAGRLARAAAAPLVDCVGRWRGRPAHPAAPAALPVPDEEEAGVAAAIAASLADVPPPPGSKSEAAERAGAAALARLQRTAAALPQAPSAPPALPGAAVGGGVPASAGADPSPPSPPEMDAQGVPRPKGTRRGGYAIVVDGE